MWDDQKIIAAASESMPLRPMHHCLYLLYLSLQHQEASLPQQLPASLMHF